MRSTTCVQKRKGESKKYEAVTTNSGKHLYGSRGRFAG